MEPNRILVVDDDLELFELIGREISLMGFEVIHETDGARGLERASSEKLSMIILDVGLPSLGGLEVCRRLRQQGSEVPILMLTSRSEESDKVLGFERGADDYLCKPFSIRELCARLEALLRRARYRYGGPQSSGAANLPQELFSANGLELRRGERKVYVDGTEVILTRLEFDLLDLFAKSPGRAFSREDLARLVWGNEVAHHDPSITATLSRLRKKLGDDRGTPRFIETVRGIGYRLIRHDGVSGNG